MFFPQLPLVDSVNIYIYMCMYIAVYLQKFRSSSKITSFSENFVVKFRGG